MRTNGSNNTRRGLAQVLDPRIASPIIASLLARLFSRHFVRPVTPYMKRRLHDPGLNAR